MFAKLVVLTLVSGLKSISDENFFEDQQLENGGEIFIIRDEFGGQRILQPRRKFSW